MSELRIFVSSPGDVELERQIARRVIARLDGEFAGAPALVPYFWEYEPMRLPKDFQTQIPATSSFDIVVCILWARLGSPLGPQHKRPDGTPYASGTEYEFEDAARSFAQRGSPDILVYRNRTDPPLKPRPKEVLEQQLKQLDALDAFLDRWTRDGDVFKGALTSYSDVAQFEDLLTEHLRKLIRERGGGASAPVRRASWTHGSPFRGLEAFEFDHAPVFRGRTRAVEDVIAIVRRQSLARQTWTAETGMPTPPAQFVLLSAASGMGKSSLVRAGVMPLLTTPGVVDGIALWRRATMKASGGETALFAALAEALVAPDALPELTSDGRTVQELAETLRTNPAGADLLVRGGLSQAAAELRLAENHQLLAWEREFTAKGRIADADRCRSQRETRKQPEGALALLVDQFEEIFALPQSERAGFLAALDALARCGRCTVIATMRSDFLAQIPQEPRLAALVKEGGLCPLEPPNRAELAAIVREPAREAGLTFEEDRQTGERLDDVILEAVATDPTALPLLEFALDQLYQRRSPDGLLTFSAYRALDGVEGAIARRAEEEFSTLPQAEQGAANAVFAALVNLAGLNSTDKPVRRRAPLTDFPTPEARGFIDHFVTSRLLVRETGAGGAASVSVAHEALFTHWARLREWVETNRDLLRIRGRVELAAARWLAEERASDLLLREGRLLAEARDLVGDNVALALAPGTLEFVTASLDAERRRRQRRLAIAACVGIGLTLAGVISVAQWRSLEANRIEAALGDYRNAIVEANRVVLSGGPRSMFNGTTLRTIEDVLAKRQAVLDRGGPLPPSDAADMAKIHELLGVFQVFAGRRDRLQPELEARDLYLARAAATNSRSTIVAELTNPHLGTVFELQTELAIANAGLKRQLRAKAQQRGEILAPADPTSNAEQLAFMEGMAMIWQARNDTNPSGEGFALWLRAMVEVAIQKAETGNLGKAVQDLDAAVAKARAWLDAERAKKERRRRAEEQKAFDAIDAAMKARFELLRDAGRPEEALTTARSLVELYSRDPDNNTFTNQIEGRTRVAQALLRLGRSDDAKREIGEVSTYQINQAQRGIENAWNNYASAARRAANAHRQIQDDEPGWRLLRSAYDTLKARGEASRSQVLNTEDALVWSSILTGRAAEVEDMARRIVDATGGNWKNSATINLAHVLLLTGRPHDALPLYAEASEGWDTQDSPIIEPSYRADKVLNDLSLLEKRGLAKPEFAEVRRTAEAARTRAVSAFTASQAVPKN